MTKDATASGHTTYHHNGRSRTTRPDGTELNPDKGD